MICIRNENTNPYFNLASEEYILRSFTENCFMLYRNEPSIIVGKHQNTLAEINYDFVKKNKIDVARRLSGGGTVFHDLGNLNFAFFQNVKGDDNLVDFKKYTKPIIQVLKQLGIDAKFEGRNDIMVNGRKISGNAEHVYKKRVLHHGTLLFSSELKDLSGALKVNPLKYTDKGVKSVRSRVANINDYLQEKISVIEFMEKIYSFVHETNLGAQDYHFNEIDIQEINKLISEKYSTWKWNFGYSPKYTLERPEHFNQGRIEISLKVEKGVIKEARLSGSFFRKDIWPKIEIALVGLEHEENLIFNSLQEKFQEKLIPKKQLKQFVSILF